MAAVNAMDAGCEIICLYCTVQCVCHYLHETADVYTSISQLIQMFVFHVKGIKNEV